METTNLLLLFILIVNAIGVLQKSEGFQKILSVMWFKKNSIKKKAKNGIHGWRNRNTK